MRLMLKRDYLGPDCTLGVLRILNFSMQTLERPWVPNPDGSVGGTKGVSCVPPGVYKLQKHSTEAHPKTWALVNKDLNVLHWPDASQPNARTAVLIHPANYVAELRGCIAPGMERAHTDQWMVIRSREAMTNIMNTVVWTDDHTLEIYQ